MFQDQHHTRRIHPSPRRPWLRAPLENPSSNNVKIVGILARRADAETYILLSIAAVMLCSLFSYWIAEDFGALPSLLSQGLCSLYICHVMFWKMRRCWNKSQMKLVEYVVIATTLFGLSAFFEVTTKMQYFNVGVMTVQQKELERDLREMIGPCAPQESGHRPCNSFESWFDQTDLSRVSTSDLREFLNALIMLQDMDIHPEQVGSQEEQREMERQLAAQRDALIILSRIRSPFHQYVELREKIDHLQNRQPISFSPGVATVGYLAICFGVALRTAKTTAEAFEWHL